MKITNTVVIAIAAAMLTTAASAQTDRASRCQARLHLAGKLGHRQGRVGEDGPKMRAQTFGGSGIYVPQVSAGTLQFGLANELETHFAVTGTGIYKGRAQPDLQIASVLVPFRVALFPKKGSDIKTVADLKGKRVPSGWTSQKIIGVLMDARTGECRSDLQRRRQGAGRRASSPAPTISPPANSDVFFFVVGAGKVKETAARVGGIQVVEINGSPDAR